MMDYVVFATEKSRPLILEAVSDEDDFAAPAMENLLAPSLGPLEKRKIWRHWTTMNVLEEPEPCLLQVHRYLQCRPCSAYDARISVFEAQPRHYHFCECLSL